MHTADLQKPALLVLLNAVSIDSKRMRCLSGGDRIAIELTKRWVPWCTSIHFMTCTSGARILRDYIPPHVPIQLSVIPTPSLCYRWVGLSHLYKTVRAFFVMHRWANAAAAGSWLYSSSDFWPDALPAIYARLRNPSIRWIAGFYLFAPTPWQADSPYRTHPLRWLVGLCYWLTQRPVYWAVRRWANAVCVTSVPDVKKFITRARDVSHVVVVQGGVDVSASEAFLASNQAIPTQQRAYDACFVGRFHYQKGVLELMDIWERVVARRPSAKLAMIGVGPLEQDIRERIREKGLERSVVLLGFLDGEVKYKIFKESKIIVHPATYDSGGMAAAEGMAWGLPGVSFDLEALQTYYPEGMIKTPRNDLDAFALNILRLLEDEAQYHRIARDARTLVLRVWDWEQRARRIFFEIQQAL